MPVRRGGKKSFRKPLWDTAPENSNHHGRRSEARVMDSLGFQQTMASGAIEGHKSDGYSDTFRAEAKSTIHRSISLKKSWLDKITREALETNRTPILTVSFVNVAGEALDANSDFIVLRKRDFEFLLGDKLKC